MILHSNRGTGQHSARESRQEESLTEGIHEQTLTLASGGPGARRKPHRRSGRDVASPAKSNAGTVVFIHDQEPPNLQGPWVGNNLYATSLVLNNIWYGCQIRNASAAFVPRLCTAQADGHEGEPADGQVHVQEGSEVE